jgi:hypothetical protein
VDETQESTDEEYYWQLVLYTNLEVIQHGAEICLLRDLYRWNV